MVLEGGASAREYVKLLKERNREAGRKVENAVAEILENVRRDGDRAVRMYADKFDGGAPETLELPREQVEALAEKADPLFVESLKKAAENIRDFHQRQKQQSWLTTREDGVLMGQRIRGLARVGLYVPGGTAAYPSSVLMNAMPAHVAGVPRIEMVFPTPGGERNQLVLAAAALAGVSRAFTIGGAQAVAALAYGTKTLDPVDKIVGPGNAYVAAAKRYVFGRVGIDMIAGPSEILVICDGKTPADWIAMDLFSQAEHDELAQAILLTPDAAFAAEVQKSIEKLLPTMPRKAIIEKSLANRGAIIVTRDLLEACKVADTISPEHLEISTENPEQWVDHLRHAGAIFMGRWSVEALGDYCAGPNHVLPTSRTARFSSPLGVYDFLKRTSIIHVSEAGAQALAPVADVLARGEHLIAHATSADYRLKK